MHEQYTEELYNLLQHSIQVSNLAFKIAQEMRLDETQCKVIAIAGALHDIGKLKLQQSILNKQDKLNKKEFNHIKKHPTYSIDILENTNLSSYIKECIIQHHENIDGIGYPENLKENEILIEAKILKIADVFDALTSERPYRKELTTQEALKIMKKEIKKYDQNTFEILIKVLEKENFKLYNKIIC